MRKTKMFTERATDNYTLERDRFGNYLITRYSDNHCVYLQGDDAVQFENEYGTGCINDAMFDWACSQYDHVMLNDEYHVA